MFSYGRLAGALILTMCLVRGGLAAWCYLSPTAAFDGFGMTQEPTSVANYLVRVWAGRDVVIALLVLTARAVYLKRLLIGCIAIECSDFAAATLAHTSGIFTMDQLMAQYATIIAAFVPEAIALALIFRADARACKTLPPIAQPSAGAPKSGRSSAETL